MEPRIELLPQKKLIGKHVTMSLLQDRTLELWQGFMPIRKLVQNTIGTDLYCLQVYEPGFDFSGYTPDTVFEKWAAIEVTGFTTAPPGGMDNFELPGGLYAVFPYKGRAADFKDTFMYIYYTWMPKSGYEVDHRPHFEVLGEKYKNNDPESEEDIWVPIKKK